MKDASQVSAELESIARITKGRELMNQHKRETRFSLQTVRMTPHSDLHSSPAKKSYHSANINIGEASKIRGCKTYNF